MNQVERLLAQLGKAEAATESRLITEMIGMRADKDKDQARLKLFAQLDSLPLLVSRFKAQIEKGEL